MHNAAAVMRCLCTSRTFCLLGKQCILFCHVVSGAHSKGRLSAVSFCGDKAGCKWVFCCDNRDCGEAAVF